MENKTYLNRYRVRHDANGVPIELRRSANSVTYHAEDFSVQREVALEVVSAPALTPEMQEMLENEARAAQQLSHVNLPRLYDFGLENDELIYATEYFEGTTGEAWIAEHGPMPPEIALRIAQQAVAALGAATFHGTVHHAINPKAILLVPGQTAEGDWPLIKVLNLAGAAPPSLANVAATTAVFDSAAQFASPEQLDQLEDNAVDFRSGIYSLGCTLWFLLTGVVPANGVITQVSGVPKPVAQLVVEMIAPDRIHRPHDPVVLQQRLRAALGKVERRGALRRRFGLPVGGAMAAPVAPIEAWPAHGSASDTALAPRRKLPIIPLAFAATVLALGTLVALLLPESLRPGHFYAKGEPETIGVPVGIPEPAANAVASNVARPSNDVTSPAPAPAPAASVPAVTEAPSPVAAIASTNAEEPSTAAATPPAVLASIDPDPPAGDTSGSPAPPAAEATAPTDALAANTSAPSSGPTEAVSPGEGLQSANAQQASSAPPVTVAADESPAAHETQPAPAVAAAAEPKPAATPAPVLEEDQPAPVVAQAEPPKRARPVAKRAERSVSQARNQPRRALPHGSVRAEYVGTTPDGELVFGVPSSNERLYANPPDARVERRSQRVRRALPPVLPAIPVDPSELPPDERDE